MNKRTQRDPSRRDFFRYAAGGTGLGLTAMLAGCGRGSSGGEGEGRRLRALFSNAGLQTTWCSLGKKTAELWGELMDVEIVWIDGELDVERQRNKLELHMEDDFDFACIQPNAINTLEQPVKRLKERGVPVISMDVLVVEPGRMREAGVWLHVTPDHEFMGEASGRALLQAINGRGQVIHIGGNSAHSGAQQRGAGFEKALADYPEVQVAAGGVRWCDWDKGKARATFESILQSADEPIAGAFFHNDDMALACVPALDGTKHEGMLLAGVDGQKEGLDGVRDGHLLATTVNPVCLIHFTALAIGQFIARNGETIEEVPELVVTPGPLVSRETGNLEAQLYLADPRHCLV